MIKKVFKESTKQFCEKHYWQTSGEEWESNNQDSLYYHADTIKLYNFSYYYLHCENCCKLIIWNFRKSHSFDLSELFPCTEPPRSSISSNSLYKIKIRHVKNQFYIRTYNLGRLITIYKVSKVQPANIASENYYELILVRERSSLP